MHGTEEVTPGLFEEALYASRLDMTCKSWRDLDVRRVAEEEKLSEMEVTAER